MIKFPAISSTTLITYSLQYWLVHRGLVDVPSMYHPHGRYRYVGGVVSRSLPPSVSSTYCVFGKNWRALLALAVSASPLLPGLVNSIDKSIGAGGAVYLFKLAWLFGVSSEYSFGASSDNATSLRLRQAFTTWLPQCFRPRRHLL
jgi:cytosine/uracil/thiamine/allantoin permease